jgi:VanZ family protein
MVKHTKHLLAIESRLLLFLAILFISLQSIAPADCSYGFTWNDKVAHFIAFFVLAFLLDFSFPRSTFNLVKIAVLILYGGGIEIVQHFIPFRECSSFDMLADISGIGLYWIMQPVLKHIPLLKHRWDQ